MAVVAAAAATGQRDGVPLHRRISYDEFETSSEEGFGAGGDGHLWSSVWPNPKGVRRVCVRIYECLYQYFVHKK